MVKTSVQESKLLVEISTEYSHSTPAEFAVNAITAASIYTDSLADLIRMARGLDQVDSDRDRAAFTEGIANVCRIVNGLQDAIRRAVDDHFNPEGA